MLMASKTIWRWSFGFVAHNLSQRFRRVCNLLVRQLRIDRHAENTFAGALSVRKVPALITQGLIGLLQMDGEWIMNSGLYAVFFELGTDGVTVIGVDDEHMIDPIGRCIALLHLHARARQDSPIDRPQFGTARIPRRQPSQLDAQDGTLITIHPIVVADLVVSVTARFTVRAQRACVRCHRRVFSREPSAFPVSAQILAWIKTERRGVSD